MKWFINLFVTISIVLAPNTFAADATVNNVIKVGGYNTTDNASLVIPVGSASSLITISGYVAGSSANNFYRFTKWGSNGGTQYQVPVGKTFYVTGIRTYMSGVQAVTFGYGTAALIANNTATPPTGAVYFSTGTGEGGATFGSGVLFEGLNMSFPANSFPFFQSISASATYNVVLMGFEA